MHNCTVQCSRVSLSLSLAIPAPPGSPCRPDHSYLSIDAGHLLSVISGLGLASGVGEMSVAMNIVDDIVDIVAVSISSHRVWYGWSSWHTLLCLVGQWKMVWIWQMVLRSYLDWKLC